MLAIRLNTFGDTWKYLSTHISFWVLTRIEFLHIDPDCRVFRVWVPFKKILQRIPTAFHRLKHCSNNVPMDLDSGHSGFKKGAFKTMKVKSTACTSNKITNIFSVQPIDSWVTLRPCVSNLHNYTFLMTPGKTILTQIFCRVLPKMTKIMKYFLTSLEWNSVMIWS